MGIRRNSLSKAFLAAALLVFAVSGVVSPAQAEGAKTKPKRQVCITFDELPAARSFGDVDSRMISNRILDVLAAHEVKAAGFVVGETIGDGYDLLGEWLNRGHILGNLTYSHQDLNDLGYQNFIPDIVAGQEALEPMLEGFGQELRYFRYPFLHYGTDPVDKQQVREFLDRQGIIVAHASVVVEDYVYNLSLEKMGREVDSSDYHALIQEYLNHVVDRMDAAEALSTKLLNRPCRHILQLRANRLNASSLDALLTALEQLGWEFIPLDYALHDEVYQAPEAYTGPRGVGYLEMIEKSDPDLLPAE